MCGADEADAQVADTIGPHAGEIMIASPARSLRPADRAAKVAKVALLTRARDRAGVAGRASGNRISGLRIGESMR